MVQAPRRSGPVQTAALFAIFIGAVLVWGMSMWVVKTGLKGPVLEMVEYRAQQQALTPWLKKVSREPLEYEVAVSSPIFALGRPVLWMVTGNGEGGSYVDGDDARPVRWTNPGKVHEEPAHLSGKPYRALAVVERGGDSPVLRFLGLVTPEMLEVAQKG